MINTAVKLARQIHEATKLYASRLDKSSWTNPSYRPDLNCWCAIASRALEMALEQKNIKAKMFVGECEEHNHCWVEAEGVVLDITYAQFDENKSVNIFPAFNKLARKYKTAQQVIDGDLDWDEQSPREKHGIEIIKIAESIYPKLGE